MPVEDRKPFGARLEPRPKLGFIGRACRDEAQHGGLQPCGNFDIGQRHRPTLAPEDRTISGARVDAIAARTRTSKRMIYYYFGGKEQLYLAVLEEAYRSIRTLEDQLDIERCDA
jgi:hypothetical protein